MTHDLVDMLSYKRPAGSTTESEFIERYIRPTGAAYDGFGNLILRVGESRTLFSSHTDTVHRKQGRQAVAVAKGSAMSNGSCLGADDTTGVWIMLGMIASNVPGLYVFHRAEEIGAKGSGWIVDNTPELLDNIDRAVAFDRYGYDSVITKQASGRTASDGFAIALADALNLGMSPDPTGSFTDTDQYAGIVPECTNVSVGYFGAHTAKEAQDLGFAGAVLRACCAVDWEALPTLRDPTIIESRWGEWRDDKPIARASSYEVLLSLVYDEPCAVADLLLEHGFNADDILDYLSEEAR